MSGDAERDLQVLLRNIAAAAILALLGALVVVAIFTPIVAPHARPDTTLLLGLAGSLLGALLMLLGLQASLRGGSGK